MIEEKPFVYFIFKLANSNLDKILNKKANMPFSDREALYIWT